VAGEQALRDSVRPTDALTAGVGLEVDAMEADIDPGVGLQQRGRLRATRSVTRVQGRDVDGDVMGGQAAGSDHTQPAPRLDLAAARIDRMRGDREIPADVHVDSAAVAAAGEDERGTGVGAEMICGGSTFVERVGSKGCIAGNSDRRALLKSFWTTLPICWSAMAVEADSATIAALQHRVSRINARIGCS